ncbi:MAG: hypothetical protein MK202_02935 [Tenacibaculum sp.]|nr:hypothetical protein [Tenacibaculum sp.]
MFQEVLIQEVGKNVKKETSIIEAVATALDISYDAAHRRTSFKSKFSLDESVKLAQYFNISLDKLFGTSTEKYVSVSRTASIKNEHDLQEYFETSYNSLLPLLDRKDCEVYYSAKDIPLFYTLKNNKLSSFKMYVWLKLLDKNFRTYKFEEFTPGLSTLQSAQKLGDLYKDLNTSEIWDITTINSTLKQIHFYYKAGQLSLKVSLELCEELKELLDDISKKVVSKKHKFKLYHNELLLMSNNVLIITPEQQSLFVPCAMLSYLNTRDKETCLEAKQYFDKQFYHSRLLNTVGEKEQNQFYYKMMQKIDALCDLIKAQDLLGFE